MFKPSEQDTEQRDGQLELFIVCRLTPRFHLGVHCVTAPIQFCSSVRQPPPVAFWVRHGTVRLTAGVTRLKGCSDNHIITRNRSYRYVLQKQQHKVFLTEGLVEEPVFISYLRFVCWCQHRAFYLISDWKLYCCFDAWIPVCSVLNSAELLRRAPASARNSNPAYLCWRALDCQSWDGADTQRTGPGGS